MRNFILISLIFLNFSIFAVTRGEAVLKGDGYVRTKWTCSSQNVTGNSSCMSGIANVYKSGNTYTGVAYDWGGYMSVETYLSRLAEGYRAGSCSGTSCSKYGILDCTVGVDCSAYVSMLWGCGHKTTRSIPDISTGITKSSLKKGDVFNNAGSHVIMYIYTDKSTGLPYVMESAGTGTEKTIFRRMSSWPSSSYEFRRYKNIEEDKNVDGTVQNPRIISATPYYDEGNTRNVISHVIDNYSCAPDKKEFGPEVIYKIILKSAGALTATVTDNQSENIDCDVHLLTSLNIDESGMALDAIARNDHTISETVEAGTYYIVVDTYTGSIDNPGEYTLSVDFVPFETPDDSDPTPDENNFADENNFSDEENYFPDENEFSDDENSINDEENSSENGSENDGDEEELTDYEHSENRDSSIPEEEGGSPAPSRKSSGCSSLVI
ncbi:MAG: hypothetical protein ACOX2F_05445 [bacterium]